MRVKLGGAYRALGPPGSPGHPRSPQRPGETKLGFWIPPSRPGPGPCLGKGTGKGGRGSGGSKGGSGKKSSGGSKGGGGFALKILDVPKDPRTAYLDIKQNFVVENSGHPLFIASASSARAQQIHVAYTVVEALVNAQAEKKSAAEKKPPEKK